MKAGWTDECWNAAKDGGTPEGHRRDGVGAFAPMHRLVVDAVAVSVSFPLSLASQAQQQLMSDVSGSLLPVSHLLRVSSHTTHLCAAHLSHSGLSLSH